MESVESRQAQLGRYEILGELGRGAMGIVYKARDPQIDRLVALKTISLLGPCNEEKEEYLQRFAAEARAAGRLSHPGIVTIFDVGEQPESHSPFIVMEYVAGESLNDIIKKMTKVPLELALQIAQELAEALDYAHTQGVVHRDVKPANVLITDEGHAKITDFGIAKMNRANITVHGYAIGTPAYMSPEQLEGGEVDGRSDIFSLGVILYTTLTGYRPFQGSSAATVSFKVTNREPVPASALDAQIPSEVDYVIARAIAKDPTQRYQTGREMALDINELLRGRLPRSLGEHSVPNPGSALPDLAIKILKGTSLASSAQAQRVSLFSTWTRLFPRARPFYLVAATLFVSLVGSAAFLRLARKPAEVHQVSPVLARSTAPPQADSPRRAIPRSQASSSAKAAASSSLRLLIENHFLSAKLSVWIDGKLAYSQPLRGEKKRRLVFFHGVRRNTESATIPLSAGLHKVSVRVEAEDDSYDQTQTVISEFPAHQITNLRIACHKQAPKLLLTAQAVSP